MLPFEISPGDAKLELENNPGALLLDCREPGEVAVSALGGARYMPMGEIPSRAHQELDPEQKILVLCHHGVRSLSAAVWLRREGFEHAQSIAGGIDRWSREVDAGVPRY